MEKKEYRAVANKVLVDMNQLTYETSTTRDDILRVLSAKGIIPVDVDICTEARKLVGSNFRRGALPSEAPTTFDCSSLVKYVFGLVGFWLPRLSIQQFNHTKGVPVQLSEIQPGDVIYRKGRINRHEGDGRKVGHAGLYVGNSSVIDAKNLASGVIETNLEEFCANNVMTGVRRFISLDAETVTLEFPETICIETSDDVRWIVLQEIHQLKKNPDEQ